ncbi:MAG TPA: cytochrome c oxidase assembly protein [Acidimicrobiales bacterium]|nr:cytochrome c oxidase assembly protein [Acidimicrobiales bacterium]
MTIDILPALRGSRFLATQWDVVPVAMILAALGLYLWGVARVNRTQLRHPWPGWKTTSWVAALLVTAFSIFSFVGIYDTELFWDHMVQHLLLIMVAAPLFAAASPLDLAWRATTGEARAAFTRLLRSRPSRAVASPVVAFVLYAVLIPVSHLTSWYNLTLEHESLHNAEHVAFLVVGYLFWRQMFGSDPNRYRMHPGLQLAYLFVALPVDTFTGVSLTNVRHELFPAYLASPRNWGPSLVQDLHIGGTLMWVGGDTLMMWPMVPVALKWMRREERRAERADREADALGLGGGTIPGAEPTNGPAPPVAGPVPGAEPIADRGLPVAGPVPGSLAAGGPPGADESPSWQAPPTSSLGPPPRG